jgi:hypothetical protein
MTKKEYKELLKKYIQHIKQCEGISFISKIGSPESEVFFTDDEWHKLMELERQIDGII